MTFEEAEAHLNSGEMTLNESEVYRNLYKYASLRMDRRLPASSAYQKVYPEADSSTAKTKACALEKTIFVKSCIGRIAKRACASAQVNADLLVKKALDLVNFSPKSLKNPDGSFKNLDDLSDFEASAINKLDIVSNENGDEITRIGWVSSDKAITLLADMYKLSLEELERESDRERLLSADIPDDYKDKAKTLVDMHMRGELSDKKAKATLEIIRAAVDAHNADMKDFVTDLVDALKDLS